MWAELPDDVFRELLDPAYQTRTHGKKATSAKGCKGPLCRKAERDEKFAQRHARAQAEGVEIKVYKKSPEKIRLDEELNRILAWHWLVRSEPENTDEELLSGISQRSA